VTTPTTRIIDNNEGIVIARQQDVEPMLDYARGRRIAGDTGSGDMRLAAEFPMIVVENYCNQAGITFEQFLADPAHAKRMLGDPSLSGFRVWQGRA
jgi:hypothetical protein